MKGERIENGLNEIIKEIGKITGDIRGIKEDIRNDIRQLRDRIDELEGNFKGKIGGSEIELASWKITMKA